MFAAAAMAPSQRLVTMSRNVFVCWAGSLAALLVLAAPSLAGLPLSVAGDPAPLWQRRVGRSLLLAALALAPLWSCTSEQRRPPDHPAAQCC